jgi:hypothetical protein
LPDGGWVDRLDETKSGERTCGELVATGHPVDEQVGNAAADHLRASRVDGAEHGERPVA